MDSNSSAIDALSLNKLTQSIIDAVRANANQKLDEAFGGAASEIEAVVTRSLLQVSNQRIHPSIGNVIHDAIDKIKRIALVEIERSEIRRIADETAQRNAA